MSKLRTVKVPGTSANIKFRNIYPGIGKRYDTNNTLVKDMKTIGLEFTPAQAKDLALKLLVCSNNATLSEVIILTGHRQQGIVTTLLRDIGTVSV